MKTKIAVALGVLVALGVGVGGVAAKGKPSAPRGFQAELKALGIACPAGAVQLQGSFAGAGDGFLALTVTKASGRSAAALKGKQVSLRLLKTTKVLRHGPTVVTKLTAKDHLSVVALMCSQGLVARTITAK